MTPALSVRERECLQLLANGLSNKRMASYLQVSEATIAMHIINAKSRLQAATREQAVAIAVASGQITVRAP